MIDTSTIYIPKEFQDRPVLAKKAAANGDVNTQFLLGIMYLRGEGVFQDTEKAAYWIHEAARNGHEDAIALSKDIPETTWKPGDSPNATNVSRNDNNTASYKSDVETAIDTTTSKEKLIDEEGIHWTDEQHTTLDFDFYKKLKTVKNAIEYGVGYSLLIAIITSILGIINGEYVTLIFNLVSIVPFCIVGIIGEDALEHRKPNTLFMCLSFSWLCLFSNVINTIYSFAIDEFPGTFAIIWIIYGTVCLYYQYSKEAKTVFPKEFRKVSIFNYVLVAICALADICVYSLFFLFLAV